MRALDVLKVICCSLNETSFAQNLRDVRVRIYANQFRQ